MKRFKQGQDFEYLIPEQYKKNIVHKIGGYCVLNTPEGLFIQGSVLVNCSYLFEPLVQIKFYRGKDLLFMHKDWDLDMEKLYTIVNIPILNKDDEKPFLTFWVFKTTEEAYKLFDLLVQTIESSLNRNIDSIEHLIHNRS